MFNLTIESRGQYRNKKGSLVFRYAVKGKQEALDAYEEAQGSFYTVDDETNEPMYFTTRFAGKRANLVVTEAGKVYVDMSELEQQASLVAQLGGNLGLAMATEIAKRFAGGGAVSTPAGKTADKTETPDGKQDDTPPVVSEPAKATRRVRR